jgi:hypothetical protein
MGRGIAKAVEAAAEAAAKAAKGIIDWYSDEPRAEYVRALMDELRSEYSRFNIIIHRQGRGRWLEDPQGIIPGGRFDVKFTGRGPDAWFSVLIFSGGGKFERLGDGGFANWRYRGWADRQGDRVVLFRQSAAG